jgi:hypothetical protein
MSEKEQRGTCEWTGTRDPGRIAHEKPHTKRSSCLRWQPCEPVASPQATTPETRLTAEQFVRAI